MTICRRETHREAEAFTLDSLGYIAHRTGDLSHAVDRYHEALAVLRELGAAYNEADVLDRLGQAHNSAGQHEQARAVWHQAVQLYREQRRVADVERVSGCLASSTS